MARSGVDRLTSIEKATVTTAHCRGAAAVLTLKVAQMILGVGRRYESDSAHEAVSIALFGVMRHGESRAQSAQNARLVDSDADWQRFGPLFDFQVELLDYLHVMFIELDTFVVDVKLDKHGCLAI